MISRKMYFDNLILAQSAIDVKGDVVECGVWRGGMIAGIAEVLGAERKYYLFDSFEGLPDATEIDGTAAKNWQADKTAAGYHDNCKAEIDYSVKAMTTAGVQFECISGWFDKTIPAFKKDIQIGLLRLDGDWYESTWVCLEHLFPLVVDGGLIIIDDYYTWTGCSRAVHDYLSSTKSASRVSCTKAGVAYIIKKTTD